MNNISTKQNLYFSIFFCQHPLCYTWQEINFIKYASTYLSLLRSELPLDTNHLNHSMYMVYNTYSKKLIINNYLVLERRYFIWNTDINDFDILRQLLKSNVYTDDRNDNMHNSGVVTLKNHSTVRNAFWSG